MSIPETPKLSPEEVRTIRQEIIEGIGDDIRNANARAETPLAVEVVASAINDLRAASGMLNTFFETAVVRGMHHPDAKGWHPQALAFDFSHGFDIYFNEDWVLTQSPAKLRGGIYQIFLQVANGGITKIGDRDIRDWEVACNFVMNAAMLSLVNKMGGEGFLQMPSTTLIDEEYVGKTIEQAYDMVHVRWTSMTVTETDEDGEVVSFSNEAEAERVRVISEAASIRVQAIIDKISHGLSPFKPEGMPEDIPGGINIAELLTSAAGV